MVRFLREADQGTVVEVARTQGICDSTIWLWCKRFGKREPVDVKQLLELEQENAEL